MSEKPPIAHLIRLHDLPEQDVDDLLDLSSRIKRRPGGFQLNGKSVGMLFFRGSLRTRASFEAAMQQLGGHSINLNASSDFWELETTVGGRMDGKSPEHVKDAAAVLSRYVNVLAIRPALGGQSWAIDRRDEDIQSWARYAEVPVINMESALWHPLQSLADLLTLRETLGPLRKKKLAIVWTNSPTPASSAVTNSLLLSAARAGMDVRVAHPSGYELDDEVLSSAAHIAEIAGTTVETGLSAKDAVSGAHVVYARSWQGIEDYGNPTLSASRRARERGWMIDEALMRQGADAKLMHAMPVRRNLEVTDEVFDGARSLIYAQAENRLHTQKAVLVKFNRT
ncbi:MAG: N-acetylornithine carbamoyltransferase [Planctomycetes bacterium]|nr:N-acetylornithine carbamoyltransferase [Planctomycetota bacterium]